VSYADCAACVDQLPGARAHRGRRQDLEVAGGGKPLSDLGKVPSGIFGT
jgi:hypothetical protein